MGHTQPLPSFEPLVRSLSKGTCAQVRLQNGSRMLAGLQDRMQPPGVIVGRRGKDHLGGFTQGGSHGRSLWHSVMVVSDSKSLWEAPLKVKVASRRTAVGRDAMYEVIIPVRVSV